MRIVAGAWRGRRLVAPPGQGTRPTADRARQALFDMLMHADWGGRPAIEGVLVLDVFAGTGALGLEALSRGASQAVFIESDSISLRVLRTNIAACKAQDRSLIVAADALGLSALAWPTGPSAMTTRVIGSNGPLEQPIGPEGQPQSGDVIIARRHRDDSPKIQSAASLVFLDPPYGQGLVPRALSHLTTIGCIAGDALIIAETGRDETWFPEQPLLAERYYGAARILVFRAA